jgi:hypothetical protein
VRPVGRVAWTSLPGCVGMVAPGGGLDLDFSCRGFDLLFFETAASAASGARHLSSSGFGLTVAVPMIVSVVGRSITFLRRDEVEVSSVVPHLQGTGASGTPLLPLSSAEDAVPAPGNVSTPAVRLASTVAGPHMVTVFPKSAVSAEYARGLPGFLHLADLCSGVLYSHVGIVFDSEEAAQAAVVELRPRARRVSSPVMYRECLEPWVVAAGRLQPEPGTTLQCTPHEVGELIGINEAVS